MTVGDLARTMPRINAALDNRQADYQTSMVEVKGNINQTPMAILIDPRASLSYISPNLVEKCKLLVEKIVGSWLVQLATSASRSFFVLYHMFIPLGGIVINVLAR